MFSVGIPAIQEETRWFDADKKSGTNRAGFGFMHRAQGAMDLGAWHPGFGEPFIYDVVFMD